MEDNRKVREIGTGTGYKAGLLSHRVHDRNVYAVAVDTDLVERARDRLTSVVGDLRRQRSTHRGAGGRRRQPPQMEAGSTPLWEHEDVEYLTTHGWIVSEHQYTVPAEPTARLHALLQPVTAVTFKGYGLGRGKPWVGCRA